MHEWVSPHVRKGRTPRHGIGMNAKLAQGRLGPAGIDSSHPEMELPLKLCLNCWHFVPLGAAIRSECTNPFRE
jgi:hypothetical protein